MECIIKLYIHLCKCTMNRANKVYIDLYMSILYINLYTVHTYILGLNKAIQECLTPDLAELLPLNKVSMGFTAVSTSTPMMVTVTPPLHIGER